MLTSFFRTLILLVVVVLAVRIMGKRQIGQLQPAELVVTILLSEIAATPMQDNDIPMLNTIIAIFVLISVEILMSVLSMKSLKMRSILQGNPVIVIKKGKIDRKQMERLRFTLDDLLEALRQKDVFDISQVDYAVAETDGSLSVLLKSENQTVTNGDMNIQKEDNGMPTVIVMDGKIALSGAKESGIDEEKLTKLIKKTGLKTEEIYLMTVDGAGNTVVLKKENRK